MLARVLLWTLASIATDLVDAQPAVLARRWVGVALVDVLLAGLSREEWCAGTCVLVVNDGALATVSTGVRGTLVPLLALFTCELLCFSSV